MTKDFLSSLRPALVMALLFAALLGIAYPLALTGIGQALFPFQANGSLIQQDGKVIGSALIGQGFASDRYFTGRPSAAGKGYDGLASSGSNYGPTSQALADRVQADVAKFRTATPDRPVPSDLVTASASGLDPHISPEAAFYQVDRVARARSLSAQAVRSLVIQQVEQPLLGFIGEPRVNLLELNRRLDRFGATSPK
ncbi:potassium-transporting ATPase subunit KdpC [Sphingobium aromaticiconvertens]|uniref:potassium-transporting ATPase subunit KdpC n=1 Tax=Sphingobium aromaticiconvertens TaxID=365341 RepID=UPI0030159901